jgi:hypothetical protein
MRKTKLTENGYFHLFFANGKTEMVNFTLFAANGNGTHNFVFLGRKTINGNRRLLFQHTGPSLFILYLSLFKTHLQRTRHISTTSSATRSPYFPFLPLHNVLQDLCTTVHMTCLLWRQPVAFLFWKPIFALAYLTARNTVSSCDLQYGTRTGTRDKKYWTRNWFPVVGGSFVCRWRSLLLFCNFLSIWQS